MPKPPPRRYVVNTLPRTGSSTLFRTLKNQQKKHKFGKAHVLPEQLNPENIEGCIFTFADPVDIILSFCEIHANKRHIADCRLTGNAFVVAATRNMPGLKSSRLTAEQIIDKIKVEDYLGLEKLFDAFYQNQKFPLITLRYETLWEHEKELSDFVGTSIKLPKYEQRHAKRYEVSEEDLAKIKKTYESLSNKIAAAEDCKIWEPLSHENSELPSNSNKPKTDNAELPSNEVQDRMPQFAERHGLGRGSLIWEIINKRRRHNR